MAGKKRFFFSILFYALIFFFSYYVLRHFFSKAIWFSFSIAIVYFISLYLRKLENPKINYTFLHHFATIWLGFIWIASAVTFFLDILLVATPLPVTKSMRVAGLIISMILSLLAYYNNKNLFVTEFTIPTSKIQTPLVIAHISDLHLTGSRAKTDFERIMGSVLSQNPDVIVITGDLIDIPAIPSEDCFNLLYQIKTPILFVTGNHDYYAGADYACDILKKRGVLVLRSESVAVKGIHFTGVDDPMSGKKLQKELSHLPLYKKTFNVLLYHQPKHIEHACEHGFDLMLSGHTHAGQIFPFNYFIKLQFKYVVGLHKLGSMFLYIIPGTSTWETPMRFGSRNTIALFKLEPVMKR
jgi:uncharacterized protein